MKFRIQADRKRTIVIYLNFLKRISIPYIREQKHLWLFRKSESLFLKVSNTNMPQLFLGTNFFFVFEARKLKFSSSYWFEISWILTILQLIWTTFFLTKNRDVLLLAGIFFLYTYVLNCYAFWIRPNYDLSGEIPMWYLAATFRFFERIVILCNKLWLQGVKMFSFSIYAIYFWYRALNYNPNWYLTGIAYNLTLMICFDNDDWHRYFLFKR